MDERTEYTEYPQHTEDVEYHVRHRRSSRLRVGGECCHVGSYGGTDVLTHHERNTLIDRQYAGGTENHRNRHDGSRTLHTHGQDTTNDQEGDGSLEAVGARRAAMAHMVFNIFGVLWILCVFRPFIHLVCGWVGFDDAMEKSDPHFVANAAKLSFVLAAFHTTFNLSNTFILVWFIPQIEKLVCKIIRPKKNADEDDFRLRFIQSGIMKTPEISVLEAQKEIHCFAERIQRMFGMVKELLGETNDDKFIKLYTRIEKYEGISDNMEIEIAKYLDQVSDSHLSDETKAKIRAMLREISEIESIGDSCFNIARTLNRRIRGKEDFIPSQYEHMHQMMELTDNALTQMNITLVGHKVDNDANLSFNIENEINNYRNQLKSQNINDVNNHLYTYAIGTMYMDIIQECEKLGDYVVNVVEARMGVRQHEA